jgi:hypothetical protein
MNEPQFPKHVTLSRSSGRAHQMEFLIEFALFLRSRWKAWLGPLLVILLLAAGLLVFAKQLPGLIAAPAGDTFAPLSRDDYRHEGA